jgi:hypothetical protein
MRARSISCRAEVAILPHFVTPCPLTFPFFTSLLPNRRFSRCFFMTLEFRQFSISTKDWIVFRKWWAQYYFLWNWIACSISSAAFGKKTAIQAFSLYANFDRTWLQNRRSCDFLKQQMWILSFLSSSCLVIVIVAATCEVQLRVTICCQRIREAEIRPAIYHFTTVRRVIMDQGANTVQ